MGYYFALEEAIETELDLVKENLELETNDDVALDADSTDGICSLNIIRHDAGTGIFVWDVSEDRFDCSLINRSDCTVVSLQVDKATLLREAADIAEDIESVWDADWDIHSDYEWYSHGSFIVPIRPRAKPTEKHT